LLLSDEANTKQYNTHMERGVKALKPRILQKSLNLKVHSIFSRLFSTFFSIRFSVSGFKIHLDLSFAQGDKNGSVCSESTFYVTER
jgi:hypothetical protein